MTPLATHTAQTRTRARTRLLAITLAALGLAACTQLGCSTDQVFDSTRYWTDRVAGATLDADPSRD